MGIPLSKNQATVTKAGTMISIEEGSSNDSAGSTYSSDCMSEHVKIPPMKVFGQASLPAPDEFRDEPEEQPSIDVAMRKIRTSSDHEAASWEDIELSEVVDDFADDVCYAVQLERGTRQDKFYWLIGALMIISIIVGVVVAMYSPGNSASPTTPPSGVVAAPLERNGFQTDPLVVTSSPQTLAPISVGEALPPVRIWKLGNETLIRTPSDEEDASLVPGKYDMGPSLEEKTSGIVAPIYSEDEP
jgi:hypothetical protein